MTGSRGRPTGTPSRVPEAMDWFRTHGLESSLRSCCDAIGVGLSTAQRARNKLKKAGELSPGFSPYDPRAGEYEVEPPVADPPPTTATAPPALLPPRDRALEASQLATTMDAALTNVLEGTVEVLTPEQTMQFLSEAVRLAPTIQLKTMVIRELNKARAAGAEQEALGPGPPLTEDDRIHRASLILQACGGDTARKAWAAAFWEHIAEVHDIPRPPPVDDVPEDEGAISLALPTGAELAQ